MTEKEKGTLLEILHEIKKADSTLSKGEIMDRVTRTHTLLRYSIARIESCFFGVPYRKPPPFKPATTAQIDAFARIRAKNQEKRTLDTQAVG